jgi:uncharacterized protein (TIGR03435 family)
MRKTLLLLALLPTCAAIAQNTPAPTPLAFDVASVRPSKPGAPQNTNVPLDAGYVYGSISPDDARTAAGGYLIATHQPLWRYIDFAYKLSATQELSLRFSFFSGVPKSGAPFWVTGSFDASPEFFDISARAPPDTSIDQMRLMMRSLLSDRFHLAAHFQTADAPAFALVLVHPGLTGPSLQPHPASDSCAAATPNPAQPDTPRPATTPSSVGDLPPVCGVIAHLPSSVPGEHCGGPASQHCGGRAIPISLFATTMPTMTGLAAIPRPVVDQTGLTGLYDFTLHWNWIPDGAETGENTAAFREALKTQLGLELKSSHAPISFLIIDHINHPSEN